MLLQLQRQVEATKHAFSHWPKTLKTVIETLLTLLMQHPTQGMTKKENRRSNISNRPHQSRQGKDIR